MKRLVSVLIVLGLLPSFAPAQSLSIEVLRPQFEFGGGEPSTFTTAWFATLSLPIYKRLHFVGQLPFAFGKLETNPVPTKDETIGNPGFGLRFDHENLTIDVGARLPLAKTGFAGFMGSLADIDRQEAFIPDILPFYGTIKTKISVGKLNLKPYGGATFNIRVERDRLNFDYLRSVFRSRANDGELFILYGGEGGFDIGKLYFGAAYNARTWVTSGNSFGTSSINQVSLRAKLDFGNVVPGAIFRFPLDDILLDSVLGLYCTFSL
jgi:hypothetical protein